MGIRIFSDDTSNSGSLPDPDPTQFTILYTETFGKVVIAIVKYPRCTTYNGMKLLLYKNTTVRELFKQSRLDPHFIDDKNGIYPFARFVPTAEGLATARLTAHAINQLKN